MKDILTKSKANGKIIYINVLSNLLLTILVGGFLIIDGVCLLLLLRSSHKKIGLLISGILIIIFSLLTFYLNKTTDVFENLNLDYKTYNYSIVVLKDSEYKKIKDLKPKSIGYYDEESEEGIHAKMVIHSLNIPLKLGYKHHLDEKIYLTPHVGLNLRGNLSKQLFWDVLRCSFRLVFLAIATA